MKTINTLFVFVWLALLLQACGKESSGSEVTRQYDRDRETSELIEKQYDTINGTFSGVVNNADVFLIVKTSRVTNSGSLVPTPTLSGTLVFSPRVSVGASDERVKVYFPYTDGTFDQASTKLSFTVEKEARPTQVTCKATPESISCSWYRRLNEVEFTLNKDDDDALEKLDAKSSGLFGGDYVGRTPGGLLVRGTFNSGLANKSDSGIPELVVIGSFIFYSETQKTPDVNAPQAVYPFSDGSYDVSSGVISATTTADNGSSIVANCHVVSTDELYCHWYSRESTEFRLYKESIKNPKGQK